ncbi:MAG: monomeric [FeFe] hydrogenase [Bacillota bacterium]
MKRYITEITRLKRRAYAELARIALAGRLTEEIDYLPQRLVKDGITISRCCEHKERAVITDRLRLALGFAPEECGGERLSHTARRALAKGTPAGPVIEVLGSACDRCPIDKIVVTNACRNCSAHHCRAVCPREAIDIIAGRAYVNQERCVACGQCAGACPFGAIIPVERPCEAACAVKAITPDVNQRASINRDKCTNCGACVGACPFGAIGDRTALVQVAGWLTGEADKRPVAMLAPSFVGQLGPEVSPGQLAQALIALGFVAVSEVAAGADLVAAHEAEEYARRVPQETPFMTSSCCPAFVHLVKKHFPRLEVHLSRTLSPALALAAELRQVQPGRPLVFIGPCLAKKGEAAASGLVDAVLTFEELGALLVGGGINAAAQAKVALGNEPSPEARGFGVSGGVARTLAERLGGSYTAACASGLADCQKKLRLAAAGRLGAGFLEGMACAGGCCFGPGVLVPGEVSGPAMENFAGIPSVHRGETA